MFSNEITLDKLLPFFKDELSTLTGDTLSNYSVPYFQVIEREDILAVAINLKLEKELSLKIPGISGFEFVIDAYDEGNLPEFLIGFYPQIYLEISGIDLGIRFPTTLFKPVKKKSDGTFEAISSKSGKPAALEITVEDVCFAIDSSGDIEFSLFDDSVSLEFNHPFMISDSGIVIDTEGIKLAFGQAGGTSGVGISKATIHLPGGLSDIIPGTLTISDAFIGSGGFTGKTGVGNLNPQYDSKKKKFLGKGSGTLFGYSFGLKKANIAFKQNALTACEIKGGIVLPFFDEPLDVDISFDLDGNISIAVGKTGGLLDFTYKTGNNEIFNVKIGNLGFERQEGAYKIHIDGEIKPLIGELQWPSFKLNDLVIDADGNISFDGGWLNLPDQYTLDFHGFKLEITKLGFGKTDDGGKWIGFSGGLKLVDGLPAGASVEGLRITWFEDGSTPQFTFNGIGVEFEVPNVLFFKGAVSYEKIEKGMTTEHRFSGDIKLKLIALNLDLDCELVIGRINGDPYMGIYLGVELPAGIPLWSTGVALYGMAGLFTQQMEPNKTEQEAWYGVDRSKSWYHRDQIGVTNLTKKWKYASGSLALGAGVTIGTVSDNGYTFSGRMLLVIVFPGPILLIEGKANMLKKRTEIDEEPLFRALAVLDARVGTFLIGLDAQYKYASGGELIEIGGSAEAFFNFNDASDWHLYLGQKEPREKRIHARIFKLFGCSSYFMLDANSLAFGSWVGYGNSWKFGPLGVTLEAWMEYNVGVSWSPTHLHGDISIHGKAELVVFWFDLGLSLDAMLAADVFDPFHLKGELSVGINLPWPLPDFSVGITLEWGPRPDRPPLPLPLKEIAVEHLKVTKSWPLTREQKLLLPNYDNNGFRQEPDKSPAIIDLAPPPGNLPVVPLDCRPHMTFTRSVHDEVDVGSNLQPPWPDAKPPGWERIGDPEKNQGPVRIKYGLQAVTLEKYDPLSKSWMTGKISKVFGSWAPVPEMPDGGGKAVAQTKLWVWSKTPFDYTRHSGRFWDEWFIERFSGYPCIPIPQDKEICYDFENVQPSVNMISPWSHSDEKNLILQWILPQSLNVSVMPSPVDGRTHELCFPHKHPDGTTTASQEITITLPQPAKEVKLIVKTTEDIAESDVTGYDTSGKMVGHAVKSGSTIIGVSGRGSKQMITRVVVLNNDADFCLLAVCISVGVSYDEISLRLAMKKHLRNEMARWEQTDVVLEPYTTYRLKIVTSLKAEGKGELYGYSDNLTQTEFAYFRTEGPPGLTKLGSGLDDLVLYVKQTVPATVPAQGQKPVLPRPVYRAYDVGVEFNENYVDLMYRIARRGLGLYLYDNNNRPVRDAQGRLIVLSNRWGETETLTPTKSDVRWIVTLNTSKCVPTLNLKSVPHDKTLTSAAEGQVLSADTVYEARLVPLLLHEDFSSFTVGTVVKGPAGKLDGWKVYDEGTKSGPSHWEIGKAGTPASFYIIQKSNVWGGEIDGTDAVKPGTYLLRDNDPKSSDKSDQPSKWTDYRLSVYLRSTDNDVIGVVFRYVNQQNHFFFAMDRERKYRRLVRVTKGKHKILAQDSFVYVLDRDYLITVEAIGSSLRVYQDGAPVFNVTDTPITPGTIGLYCWGNMGARFSDVMVDDFRQKAPVAYRFNFTTSQFANFFHHIHSFQDETWQKKLPANTNIGTLLAKAVSLTAKPSEQEARDYEALVAKVFGQKAVRPNPSEVQVTRIDQNDKPLAFLIESPEPIDWKRTDLKVLRVNRSVLKPVLSGTVKLTDVTFGTKQPNDESASVLLRKTTDLTGYQIDYRRLPGPLDEPTGNPVLFVDDFAEGDKGLIFHETLDSVLLDEPFDRPTLERWTFVDEPPYSKHKSQWSVIKGELRQTSNIYGFVGGPYNEPGTYALTGDSAWTDYIASVRLRSDDDDAIGVIFRYQDKNNYYRFSMYRERNYRRLTKKVNGQVILLWEDNVQYTRGREYLLTIRCAGNQLSGNLGEVHLFTVKDDDIASGRIGLYCRANKGAHFAHVTVTEAKRHVGQWTIMDEGTVGAPSMWRLANEAFIQTSNIHGGAAPAYPGTYAIAGNSTWTDYRLTVRMRSDDDDAIGVIFRYVNDDNYYRLSLDAQRNYRRLIKKESGLSSILWEEKKGYTVGKPFTLTVDVIGSRLVGYMGDERLFNVTDSAHAAGQIGLYCWANTGARFERVEVRRPPLEAYALLRDRFADGKLSEWSFVDEGTAAGPSNWEVINGDLRQTTDIYSPPIDRDTLSKQGTQAVAGELTWSDMIISARLDSHDDDAIGLLFWYKDANNYYRFSMDSQRGYRRLVKNVGGTFTLLWEDDFAYVVDHTYELTIVAIGNTLRGYFDGVPMFVVEDGDLPSGRIGLYCWGNHDARFSQVRVYPANLIFKDWLLNETFDVLIPDRWTFVNEGDKQGPSQWKVTDGALRQTSKIYGGSTDGSVLEKPGTYALAGSAAWKDYRISVRLRSDDDYAIGVMFRYVDENNYYRFSMDRGRSYRRLIKKVDGVVTKLWEDEDNVQYTLRREYVLTLDCVGEHLIGYLDGDQLFAKEDGELTSGRIGLYCWANTGARFAEVRVAAPVWAPYYTFGHEVQLPAGTRVQVYAGNKIDKHLEEAGVVKRFNASLSEHGQLRLPGKGADLRLRARGGTEGHTRHFLPDSDYVSVNALVLRKADGTGFFVLASPTGSALTSGQYRLKMTYRRDNRAVDPDGQAFSQAGVTDPERVTIDIPWTAD